MFRCAVAQVTAKYMSPQGMDAVERVQRQHRRRQYYKNFFPLVQELMTQRRAATVIQSHIRGQLVRAAEARAHRLLVERVVQRITRRLSIRRKVWAQRESGTTKEREAVPELVLSAYVLRAPCLLYTSPSPRDRG